MAAEEDKKGAFAPMMESGVHAGFPSPAQDYINSFIDLNKELVRHPAATFFARVVGDSMVDADVNEGDVLVVDKIGKNISGDGMDPNVSGRFVQPKYCSGGIEAEKVVILDITDETHGNAQGIGLAEVTTRRLVNRMKLEMTYPTGVTNTFLHLMKIPMIMDNDREALQLALMCCPEAEDHDNMKMIRIPNTAHIGVIEISEGMLPLAKANPNIEILSEPTRLLSISYAVFCLKKKKKTHENTNHF